MLVIGLLRFSVSPWFSFGRLYFSKNFPFLPSCSFYWHMISHSSLLIFCISLFSVEISSFSFLILLIWFFPLLVSMSLANGLYILTYLLRETFCLDCCVWGALLMQAGNLWLLLIVESAPCGCGWTNGLSRFPGWVSLWLCSGGWIWISSLWSAMKCPLVCLEVSMGLVWLWITHLFMFRVVFLFCWIISMVWLALGLVGSWVELGFSVGVDTFGWAPVY